MFSESLDYICSYLHQPQIQSFFSLILILSYFDYITSLILLFLLQTHPDARIFRERVVENYDQWCNIFGNNDAVERYSRIGNDVDSCFAVDVEVLETADASHIGGTLNDQVRNVRWTNEMDHCLCKILVEQVKLGNKNKADNKLKPAAYVAAVIALNEKFHLDLSKGHVKNRLKTWKKLYGTLKELLSQSDFKWDTRRKMVIADEFVWNYHITVNILS